MRKQRSGVKDWVATAEGRYKQPGTNCQELSNRFLSDCTTVSTDAIKGAEASFMSSDTQVTIIILARVLLHTADCQPIMKRMGCVVVIVAAILLGSVALSSAQRRKAYNMASDHACSAERSSTQGLHAGASLMLLWRAVCYHGQHTQHQQCKPNPHGPPTTASYPLFCRSCLCWP
jgi:hypothetical protein